MGLCNLILGLYASGDTAHASGLVGTGLGGSGTSSEGLNSAGFILTRFGRAESRAAGTGSGVAGSAGLKGTGLGAFGLDSVGSNSDSDFNGYDWATSMVNVSRGYRRASVSSS